jgi:hypothetical protein
MLKTATVEKTTTYKLTKDDLVKLILQEAGIDPTVGTVSVIFNCTGGEDHYNPGVWTPMDVTSATITVREKS